MHLFTAICAVTFLVIAFLLKPSDLARVGVVLPMPDRVVMGSPGDGATSGYAPVDVQAVDLPGDEVAYCGRVEQTAGGMDGASLGFYVQYGKGDEPGDAWKERGRYIDRTAGDMCAEMTR